MYLNETYAGDGDVGLKGLTLTWDVFKYSKYIGEFPNDKD